MILRAEDWVRRCYLMRTVLMFKIVILRYYSKRNIQKILQEKASRLHLTSYYTQKVKLVSFLFTF